MSEEDGGTSSRSGKKSMRSLLALLGILLVVVVVERPWEHLGTSLGPNPPVKTKLKVGAEAPDFELPTKEGKKIRLSAWSDKQPVALWFFSPT